MCGFAGIIDSMLTSGEIELQTRRMTDALRHRGPDDEGYFLDPGAGISIGFRRLSIIDVSSKGHQPMLTQDKTVVVVFNGEIYNFRELRKELTGLGHNFDSECDTEVVLYSYVEWGENFVERLNGMFTIAIWDKRLSKLLLYRDRLGIKPLYYAVIGSRFVFASEFQSLIQAYKPRELSQEAISQYLAFLFLPDNGHTLVEGVRKLPPGHRMTVTPGGMDIKPYWRLDEASENNTANLSFEDCCIQLNDLMHKSVNRRLVADVPLGILLSGGLDSSYVTALAARQMEGKVHTFTVGLEHAMDERPYARQISDHLGTLHSEMLVSNKNVFQRLPSLIRVYDDLCSVDGGFISVFLICELIKAEGTKVLLLGEGADELFGGYPRFRFSQNPFRRLPSWINTWLYYNDISKNSLSANAISGTTRLRSLFKQQEADDLFHVFSKFEIEGQLPNNYLMKVDKASMANSIEARVPFLDHNVVEFAYRLRADFKLRGKWASNNLPNEKYILRRCAESYLPREISQRKKHGFLLSVLDLMSDNIDDVRQCIADSQSLPVQLLGRGPVNRLFTRRGPNIVKRQHLYLIWKLFLLELWSKNVLGVHP